MSYATEHIASALRAARESKGLSQRELSAKSGVPQGHISKIENGKQNITVGMMVKLAAAVERRVEIRLVPNSGERRAFRDST